MVNREEFQVLTEDATIGRGRERGKRMGREGGVGGRGGGDVTAVDPRHLVSSVRNPLRRIRECDTCPLFPCL